ncbi:hypothetical protein AQ490_13140 [Wenjunlia vitaminophila]|uniref:Tetratricopeptide repeat protein n=1 Tax=Wenjunlia vitaminophila TaxID=76728 RepID=A0A0T6LYR3_WENVI|nr:tetratricopeptide repeat protein [Wenjunlia vitaminophila]KRV50892.1 hypothetical protein AQ490_13140 [Wenjunlia vitaminophila]
MHNLSHAHAPILGRDAELAWLDQVVREGNSVITQAVHGLGGVGKSTLALHYARAHRQDHTLTWWITADSPERITAGLAALAERLQARPTSHVSTANQATWALTWLQTHPGWLLVLDNVEDPAHLEPHLGQLDAGHVLITSRRATGWRHLAHPVRIDVLAPGPAADLLGRASGHTSPDHRPALTELAADLGYLPLALEQAGAYITRHHVSITTYRERLAHHPARIHATPARAGQHEATVARVWHLTLDSIAAQDPLAVRLLSVLAWLAPDQLPRDVLTVLGQDVLAVDEALALLADYSMITLTPDTVSVHRLVQTTTRTIDPHDPHRTQDAVTTARHHATALLNAALPDGDPEVDLGAWPRWKALLPHIHAHAALTEPRHDPPGTDRLFSMTALFLARQGQTDLAVAYGERAVHTAARLHGTLHPDTLASRNNLAMAHQAAGDPNSAIPLHESVLADSVRTLGPDHPYTLNSRNNLARAYHAANDVDRAISLHESILADSARVLGPDHPLTLTTRNNLARAYQAADDVDRAIPLHESVLADSARVLGPDHPLTLTTRDYLASAYQAAGHLDRAIEVFESVIADCERVLGPRDPQTLASRGGLASAYQAAGDLDRAIPLHESILADLERVLGPDHPDTLHSRNNLGIAYWKAGDAARAIPLHESVLADFEHLLGPDHPNTLATRDYLASAHRAAGDLDRAIPLYESVLADCERVLGPDRSLTLITRGNLASAYEAAGDLDRAVPLLETTVRTAERVLGPEHPSTTVFREILQRALTGDG